jgi:hypothetical protein
MNCHEIRDQLSALMDKELNAELERQVCDHVGSCEACSTELRSFARMSELVRSGIHSTPPLNAWDHLSHRLDQQYPMPRPPRRTNQWNILIAACAALLGGVGYTLWLMSHAGHDHAETSAKVRQVFEAHADDPARMLAELSDDYAGQEVPMEKAEALLGYLPAANRLRHGTFQLSSTHVLKMPCCVCSATLCKRADGSSFLVFEHTEEQHVWFGDAPSISTKCGEIDCTCIQVAKGLALTWKEGARQITVVGLTSIDEVSSLTSALSHEPEHG